MLLVQALQEERVFVVPGVPSVSNHVCQNGMFVSGDATPFLSSQVCDYRVLVYSAGAWAAPCPYCPPSNKWLVAIHGGNIDKGTSPLTAFLGACTCANLYIFEDCPKGGPGGFTPKTVFTNLHITQTNFNDKYLMEQVNVQGNWIVWVHNYWEPSYASWASTANGKATYICVSGSDTYFDAKLAAMKMAVEMPYTPLPIRPRDGNTQGRLQQVLGFNQPIYLIDARKVPDNRALPCSNIFKGGGNARTISIEFPRALNVAIEKDITPGGPGNSAGILCSMMRVALSDHLPTPGDAGNPWGG